MEGGINGGGSMWEWEYLGAGGICEGGRGMIREEEHTHRGESLEQGEGGEHQGHGRRINDRGMG
jgi:hypothetical protein